MQKNENVGVHQNASTRSPQSRHNDPQNNPTIKMENKIDETWNKNEDNNNAENEDKNGHEDPDKDKN